MATVSAPRGDPIREISPEAIAALRAVFQGDLIGIGDPGYEDARRVWNGNIDRHPALVARCRGVADVRHAVSFVREAGLLVSVRGGGHSMPGYGTNDGGLVIDLSAMKGIRVDPGAGTARAEGGVLWREFDHETQAFGLATTGGTVSNTGIAGLTLGGGLGWLMGKHGLTADNLISADVVTADAEFHTVSADQEPELFWALRGGGGNFGIVTSFEYRLHPVAEILGGMVVYPLDQAVDVARFYRDLCPTLPDEAEAYLAFITEPQAGVPVVAVLLGYNGPLDEGEKVLAPARQFGHPVADLVGPDAVCRAPDPPRRAPRLERAAALLALSLCRADARPAHRRRGRSRVQLHLAAELHRVLLRARGGHPRHPGRYPLLGPPARWISIVLGPENTPGRVGSPYPLGLGDVGQDGTLHGRWRLHQPPRRRKRTLRRRCAPPTIESRTSP